MEEPPLEREVLHKNLEASADLKFTVVRNDGDDASLVMLIQLKTIFTQQLLSQTLRPYFLEATRIAPAINAAFILVFKSTRAEALLYFVNTALDVDEVQETHDIVQGISAQGIWLVGVVHLVLLINVVHSFQYVTHRLQTFHVAGKFLAACTQARCMRRARRMFGGRSFQKAV